MHIIHYHNISNEFIVEIDPDSEIYYRDVKTNTLKLFGNIILKNSQYHILISFNNTDSAVNKYNTETLYERIKFLKNDPKTYRMGFSFDNDTIKSLLTENSVIRNLLFISLISKFAEENESINE
jgi:hypothetical protein